MKKDIDISTDGATRISWANWRCVWNCI